MISLVFWSGASVWRILPGDGDPARRVGHGRDHPPPGCPTRYPGPVLTLLSGSSLFGAFVVDSVAWLTGMLGAAPGRVGPSARASRAWSRTGAGSGRRAR
ncbi:hypothetical protein NKG05_08975 [Oerskovia sp. M15]